MLKWNLCQEDISIFKWRIPDILWSKPIPSSLGKCFHCNTCCIVTLKLLKLFQSSAMKSNKQENETYQCKSKNQHTYIVQVFLVEDILACTSLPYVVHQVNCFGHSNFGRNSCCKKKPRTFHIVWIRWKRPSRSGSSCFSRNLHCTLHSH